LSMNVGSAVVTKSRLSETSLVEWVDLLGCYVPRLSANVSQRKWPEEKITIDLESVPGFNLRAQVVGHGGAYVKHIQQETGCRVQIKGRGSGYLENSTGRESDEDMFLHVA